MTATTGTGQNIQRRAPSHERHFFLVCLLLVIATFAVYGQITNFDFVGYDDEVYITDNQHVQAGLTFKGIQWAFSTYHAGNWHPLTWLSHMLDCEIYGLNPRGHHLTNLLLHLANTLLLFFIFMRMTGALWRSAFVAALFALHPLHVESVAWMAERKDVLSTFGGMLSLLAYQYYVKQPLFTNYLLVIFFLSLGLMAKPMLVTLPFVFLLLDFWPLRRCLYDTDRLWKDGKEISRVGHNITRLVLEKVPLLIPVFISSVLTYMAEHNEGTIGTLKSFSIIARVENAFVSYVSYIFKTVWPLNLSSFYPHPAVALPWWHTLGAAMVVVGLSFWAARVSKEYPYVFVGWFWYLGTLVPVIGLIQIGRQAMADRYTYIPLIGIFLIIAWGGADLFKRLNFRKTALAVSSAVVLSALTTLTFFQIGHWENAVTLFQHAVRVDNNNGLAHNNLGVAYVQRGKFDKAVFHYKEALRVYPYDLVTILNLGRALSNQGERDEAAHYYQKGLRIKPDSADAHNALAVLLTDKGNLDEALLHCNEALRINPQSPDAHYNLGNLLIKQGRMKEAGLHFAEAIKINPNYAKGYNSIGFIMARQGKLQKALVFFSKAVQIDPNYTQARKNLEKIKQTLSSNEP
ncbi:MAG: tetratricopeptide repeat protein [Desulfobacterales bacterium]|uniref:Tetratricopeptide repeat protein n=1 Tax=Candidatus Desulfatibia vada TaxID=2841696 RepID=A0A8J6TW06_9BACT|nr:tetratricopeptide repeat protein [Candidatus Desulfatibia vada]